MRQVRSASSSRGALRRAVLIRALGVLGLVVPAVGVAGCGGGGHGFSVPNNPLVVTSAVLPAVNSGEVVNYLVPFTGGAGGPYLLSVLSGTLPAGVELDNGTVALTGRILEDGEYDFTLQLTDTGANPFATTTQHYHWSVGKGALVIITDATLPSYVYNRTDVVDLQVAGGTAPYSCEVVDVPAVADEPLPTGLSIPPYSTQIVGAPIGTKAATPFIYTVSIRATDSTSPVALTVTKQFTITVLVPDLVVTTSSVPGGKCGTPYTSKINVLDGIPPFVWTIVDTATGTNKLLGEPGSPGGVTKATGFSAYPIDTDASATYTGKFPEGVYIRETAGDIIGVPRRKGTFVNWNCWVRSSVLPAVPSQNRWKTYTFTMTDATAPNVALKDSDLSSGTWASAGKIADPEKTKNYNKQFGATGGCPQDGLYDGPHESQVTSNPSEVSGRYNFAATTFALGVPPGMAFTTYGLFSGVPTQGSQTQSVTVKATDYQLPTPLSAAHTASGVATFSIGPDTVVLTESSQSSSAQVFDSTMEVNTQTVEILEPFSSGPVVRALAATDMTATNTHPTGNTLAGSLSSIDILRVSVNPTWWAYDGASLNSKAARTMQHGDAERDFRFTSFGSTYMYQPGYYPGQYITTQNNEGTERASTPAIEIPVTAPSSPITVTHSPSTGVYTNGGLLYGYDNSSEFGFFIVRKDGKIFIPWAQTKSAGYTGLGDAWLVTGQGRGAQMRMPQITVSPDGRMAAAKVKVTVDNFIETATSERIVIFSLTGEKMFGGATYVVLTPGGSGNTNDGQYLYGSSLTLTNFGLYALRGNNYGSAFSTTGDRVIFGEHWVYRATIFNPATGAYLAPSTMALLAQSFGGVGGWTNTATGTAGSLSCTFQRWSSPGSTVGISTYTPPYYTSPYQSSGQYHDGPYSTLAGQTTSGSSMSSVSPDFYVFNWANFHEAAGAPHPFRVSANGHACAIVGGVNQSLSASPSTSVAGFLNRSVYVDYDHTFREASTVARRFQGPSRTVGIHPGETYSRQYGWFDGPSTQFEISDDGTKIAAIYVASTQAWYSHTLSRLYSPMQDSTAREALVYMQGNSGGSDPWASKTNTLATDDGRFNSSILWRLGCLAFTRDGSAVVFFGGMSIYSATSGYVYYLSGEEIAGSIYAYTPSTNLLEGILPYSQGGHSSISGASLTYTTSSPNSTTPGSGSNTIGAVCPSFSFLSNDGNFYWICSIGAILSSEYTAQRLVGVNIKDLSTTINGRTPIRAFAPNWTTYYPFATDGGYYGSYSVAFMLGAGGGSAQIGTHISAPNGVAFYASNREGYYGGTNTWKSVNTGMYYYGGCQANYQYYKNTYLGDPYMGGELFAMDINKAGNPVQLSSLGIGSDYRDISYIQPSADGSRVAFVPIQMNTGLYYQRNPSQERLYVASGISSSAAGSVNANGIVAVEATAGRVSSSVALDSTGTRIYYAFASSGSNENGMVLKEATINASGTALVGSPRSFNGVGNTANRFAVLWSGR